MVLWWYYERQFPVQGLVEFQYNDRIVHLGGGHKASPIHFRTVRIMECFARIVRLTVSEVAEGQLGGTAHDRLWLFGEATDGSNPYSRNDLWSYCTTSDQWTWVTGPSVTNDPGSWGTVGVSSPNNRPNGRLFAASWTGADGSLYVYGGLEAGSFSLRIMTCGDLFRT